MADREFGRVTNDLYYLTNPVASNPIILGTFMKYFYYTKNWVQSCFGHIAILQ